MWTQEFHERLRGKAREAAGRDPEPTADIIDSQSVKAAAPVPAGSRGFDGGKEINGRKRHIVVTTAGLLLTAMVTAANVTDGEASLVLLARLARRFFLLRLVWADVGYAGPLVDFATRALRLQLTVVKHHADASGFAVLPDPARPPPPPPKRAHDVPSLLQSRRIYACPAEARRSHPERQQVPTNDQLRPASRKVGLRDHGLPCLFCAGPRSTWPSVRNRTSADYAYAESLGAAWLLRDRSG